MITINNIIRWQKQMENIKQANKNPLLRSYVDNMTRDYVEKNFINDMVIK